MLGFRIDPNSPTHRRRLIGQRSLLGRAPPRITGSPSVFVGS
jgi:hypothetical protein